MLTVYNWLHKKKFDIIYLQETHSTEQNEQLWKNLFLCFTFLLKLRLHHGMHFVSQVVHYINHLH